jgi:hypothetical protein
MSMIAIPSAYHSPGNVYQVTKLALRSACGVGVISSKKKKRTKSINKSPSTGGIRVLPSPAQSSSGVAVVVPLELHNCPSKRQYCFLSFTFVELKRPRTNNTILKAQSVSTSIPTLCCIHLHVTLTVRENLTYSSSAISLGNESMPQSVAFFVSASILVRLVDDQQT